jgi:hypothetical protein
MGEIQDEVEVKGLGEIQEEAEGNGRYTGGKLSISIKTS